MFFMFKLVFATIYCAMFSVVARKFAKNINVIELLLTQILFFLIMSVKF